MRKESKIRLWTIAGASLPIVLFAPGRASKAKKAPFQGRNFAHRGLHTPDKSVPENSLTAFRLATDAGYGIELDVQLSRDGEVVVFHDDTLARACGDDRRVDEADWNELRRLPLFGSAEGIPLLSQALAVVGGRVPLIVELKSGGRHRQRNRELCQKTLRLLRGYSGAACVESFDPTIVAWFRFHAPELLRGQLATQKIDYRQNEIGRMMSFLFGNMFFNVAARPEFIAYHIGPQPLAVRLSEALGAMKVGWTSHTAINEKGRDAVIFEFYRPRVKFR